MLDVVQVDLPSADGSSDHNLSAAFGSEQCWHSYRTLVASSTKLMLKVLETKGSEREARRLHSMTLISLFFDRN